MTRDVLVLSGLGLVWLAAVSCGDDATKRKPRADYEAAGEGGAGAAPEAGAGGEPTQLPIGGMGGEIEVPSGGMGGPVELPSAGAGGEAPIECGPDTCPDGVCIQGVCEEETIVASNVSLGTDSLTTGRTCAEGISYSVLALDGASVTLAVAPADGCLAVGDEVLLINSQGTPAEHNNVGHWELFHVASVAESSVTFDRAAARFYGAGVNNTGLGITPSDQRVALVRVPRFGRLVLEEGSSVTAQAWDGVRGGVVALRAAQLELAGTVNAGALGYRNGRWSEDDITCSNSVQTEAGESIAGTGIATTLRNFGASGGIGPGDASYNSDNPVLATPGHSRAGEPGFNPNGRVIGEVGAAYGAPDASTLTLGSGPGGGLRCVVTPDGPRPVLQTTLVGRGGGIALLLADDLQVQPTGAVSASPPDEVHDYAFSGGYVFIQGSTLSLGEARVTALGSSGARGGQSNRASPGYVVVAADSVVGTTDPPALAAPARL